MSDSGTTTSTFPRSSSSAAGAGTPADPLLLPGGVRALWTGRAQGDLGQGAHDVGVPARRREVVDLPWTWARQVHGATVLAVDAGHLGPDPVPDADALVGGPHCDRALAVFTADCAPLALSSPEGVMAAVHVGWRGLVAGVVPAAVSAMRAAGASEVSGALGPCIRVCCYEFGAADLAVVEDAAGGHFSGVTTGGRPALDLAAAVHAVAGRSGVEVVFDAEACTACGGSWFSHRARQEKERQALVVWQS